MSNKRSYNLIKLHWQKGGGEQQVIGSSGSSSSTPTTNASCRALKDQQAQLRSMQQIAATFLLWTHAPRDHISTPLKLPHKPPILHNPLPSLVRAQHDCSRSSQNAGAAACVTRQSEAKPRSATTRACKRACVVGQYTTDGQGQSVLLASRSSPLQQLSGSCCAVTRMDKTGPCTGTWLDT